MHMKKFVQKRSYDDLSTIVLKNKVMLRDRFCYNKANAQNLR